MLDLPVQLAKESESFPSKSKKPALHLLHLSPIYSMAHVQCPFKSHGHESLDVQSEPSSFKDPSVLQRQSSKL